MSETARPGGGDSVGDSTVPSLGVVPASVAMAAVFIPLRRGANEPIMWATAALAFVTVTAFLARRHDLLERRIGGAVAAGSSLLIVLLSGYAVNQGILGTTTVPGLGWSVPTLLLAFAAASGAVGIGVADYTGISERGLKHRLVRSTEMAVLGFAGLLSMTIASLILFTLVWALVGEPSSFQRQLVNYLSTALGLGSLAVVYFQIRGLDWSYIDVEVPTLRSIGWTVGGLLLLFGVIAAISFLLSAIGVSTAEHGTVQQVERNPRLLLIIIPAMVLIVGPFEELLYRNIIQKSLYDVFSRYGSIVVMSVIFASIHFIAYATSGSSFGEVLASLAVVFGLSLVLGFIYERTDNLVVTAAVHGCFNAAQMAMVFLS